MNKRQEIFLLPIAFIFPMYAIFQLASLNTIAPILLKSLPDGNISLIPRLSMLYLLMDALFILPAGILFDHIHAKYLFPIAMCCIIFGNIFSLVGNQLWLIYWGRAIIGIGHAFAFLLGFKLIRQLAHKKKHGFYMSSMVSIAMLGGMIAQTPYALLIKHIGWEYSQIINVSCGILLMLVGFYSLSDFFDNTLITRINTQQLFFDVVSTLKNYKVILMGLLIGLLSVPLLILASSFGNIMFHKYYLLSEIDSTKISSTIFLANLVGMPFFGWLYDNGLTVYRITITSVIISIITAVILVIPWRNFYIILLLMFIVSFSCSVQSLGYVIVSKVSKQHQSNTSMAVANVVLLLTNVGVSGILSLGEGISVFALIKLFLFIFVISMILSMGIVLFVKYKDQKAKVLTYPDPI